MRKHFLILMLLSLLPLVGWAQDFVRVVPSNVSKYYGQADARVALTYQVQEVVLSTKNAAILRAGLQIQRNGSNAGEALGDYNYTMTFKKAKATAAAVEEPADETQFTAAEVDAFVAAYTVGVNGNGVLSIERMPLSEEDVAVTAIPAQIHTGSALEPTLTVKNTANGETLVLGQDYKVVYSNNIDATQGAETAVATLEGKGNYEGTTVANFAINAGMDEATITVSGVNNATYNGSVHNPTQISVKVGDVTLTKDTHYTLSWSNSNVTIAGDEPTEDELTAIKTHAGVVTMTFTGKDAQGYTGSKTYEYTIKQKAATVEDVVVTLGEAPTYSGSALKPNIAAVTAFGADVPETDYVVTTESANAGDATASLTFNNKSNYTLGNGVVKDIAYQIAKKQLVWEGDGILVEASLEQEEGSTELNHYAWTNDNIKPTVELVSETKNIPTNEYTVTYTNGNNGEYTTNRGKKFAVVKAVANGNYSFANKKVAFYIDRKPLTIKVKDFTVGYASAIAPELEFGEGYIEETPEDITKAAIIANAEFAYTDVNGDPVDIATAAPNNPNDPDDYYTVTISNSADLKVLDDTNADNYAITWLTGKLKKTQSQVFVQINDNTAEYGDAFATVGGWTVSYVSGLSDAEQVVAEDFDPAEDEPTTTMEQIIKTVYDNPDFALVTPVDFLDVNPEGYAVKYGTGVIPNTNYVVTAQPGKLIVGKKHIRSGNIQIEHETPIKYSGAIEPRHVDVSPAGEFPGHEEDNDYLPTNYYETVFSDTVNVGDHYAHVSMKGQGTEKYITETVIKYTAEDFAAYVEANGEEPAWAVGDTKEILPYVLAKYTIIPLKITITANDFIGDAAWTYGSPEGNYTATVSDTEENSGDASVEADKLAALLAGEQPEGFNGTLVVKRVEADNVGTYNEGLWPMIVDAEGNVLSPDALNEHNAAANYNITFKSGKLEVKPGTIYVKAKDVQIPYGEVPAKLYLEVVSGMENDPADFEEIATYSREPADFGYNAVNFKERGTYTLNYKGTATKPTATNYNVVFAADATGTLEVTERPVKIQIANFVKTYAELAAFKEALAEVNETKNFGPYADILEEDGFYGLTDGNQLKDLFTSVNLETENVGDNAITATAATEGAALNYVFTIIPGKLTITTEGVLDIVLNRVAKASWDDEHANTAAKVIADNDGKIVNVKFSDFSMIAEKWYPLVLPFATSVKEISKVFGYAVVDVFNGTTAEGKIKFKLHMGNIEANTPFIVKVYEDQNMSDEAVVFNSVKIVKAYDANKEVKVNEGSDVDFVGTYFGRIDGFRSNMYYFSTAADKNEYYKGNATNTTYLRPLGAYFVDNADDAATKHRVISIEEPNGNTTEISAITVDGAFVEADGWYTTNGIRLQGAPTEKGVYIRNGKKIVIK